VNWVRRAVNAMTSWLHRRPIHEPPPPPPPERLREAQSAAAQASRELSEARSRNPEVNARAASADALLRKNNLGPAFMKALGQRGA
jgi:hypothetical protein